MGRLWQQFSDFLGTGRRTALFILLAVTGLFSLMLNTVQSEGVIAIQTGLLLVFIGGATGIVFSAMSPYERGRWVGIITPSFLLVVAGSVFFPAQSGLFMGLAFGWIVAALFVFKPREPMAYQKAIKALRKNDFETAVTEIDSLIKQEPKQVQHYHFRARLYRLDGKINHARRDYKKILDIDPESPVGYNELAELELQAGQYSAARTAALKAYDLTDGDWVTAYNLGMIEDRLRDSESALKHLDHALTNKIPDPRHLLLIHLYRARALARLGQLDQAGEAITEIKSNGSALKQWRKLLEDPQAGALREVLGDDIEMVYALIEGRSDVMTLAKGS